jgi:hypothetical protein
VLDLLHSHRDTSFSQAPAAGEANPAFLEPQALGEASTPNNRAVLKSAEDWHPVRPVGFPAEKSHARVGGEGLAERQPVLSLDVLVADPAWRLHRVAGRLPDRIDRQMRPLVRRRNSG